MTAPTVDISSTIASLRESEAVATLASVGRIRNDMGGEAEVEVEMIELSKVLTSPAVESGSSAID